MGLRSAIPFFDGSSGSRVDALEHADMIRSRAWPGLVVEAGTNDRWDVDEIGVRDHFVSLNTDEHPLAFSVKRGKGFRRVVMPPGSVWFCPAGESFSHRVQQPCGFLLASLRPASLAQLAGDDGLRFERGYAISSPKLEHVLRALGAEMNDGGIHGSALADALTTALAICLVETFAERTPDRVGPSLSPHALARVRDKIDAELGSELTVSSLAGEAGLSPAHFTRAFKACTGLPPYRYIVARRLEKARVALQLPGARVLEIALRFGFADQAHFTRMFRQRFGVTPGAIAHGPRSDLT
ncbi:helix-turn-helix transcriptional regulator [Pendulispora albinea]|uniref:AraC family transcriptional regulator n=1 Tax=Pendulispora albinea TaxID=2741071 RepID=A0ABZ2M474_9BACT